MSGDVSKLPRWARDLIERLERDAAYAREQLRQGEEGDTDTWRGNYSSGNVGLPRGSRIVFTLPYTSRDGSGAIIEAQVDGDDVRVTASGGPLIISPHVSNVVTVGVERWAER